MYKVGSSGPEEGEEEEEEEDACGFVCFLVGLIFMFVVVGGIATLIVLGVDEDRQVITSLTSTHSAKPLSQAVVNSLKNMEGRTIDHTENGSPGRKLDLLVLVHSLAKDNSLRDVIRKTWMVGVDSSVEVVFVIPAKDVSSKYLEGIRQESSTHKDMVVFLDAPTMPESEALILELTWSSSQRDFEYLLKTRDSMYVRIGALMEEVRKLKDTKSNAYLGYFQGKESPRNRGSTKHREPEWFLCNYFIRFAHSGGYILSRELVNRLSTVATYLFPYNNEDVALGTWLSPYNDVNWTHMVNFDTEIGHSRGCFNDFIVFPSSHTVSEHERISSGGPTCLSEKELVKTYEYNFNMSPSKCCTELERQTSES